MKKSSLIETSLVCLGLAAFLFSCKRKPEKQEPSNGKLYLNKLVMTLAQYDSLKAGGASKLVFQFFYPGRGSCEAPTLYAYGMKAMNQSTVAKPQILSYDSVATEPFTDRAQVLGDQQMKTSSLDSLLSDYSGGAAGKNIRFVFTPKFQSDNPHVYYDIEAQEGGVSSGRSARTNPSPPASAF